MLTPEELKIIERAKELGKTPQEAIAGVQKYRASRSVRTSENTQTTDNQDSIGSRVSDVINKAGESVYSNITGTGENAGQSPIRRGFQATASAFNAIPATALAVAPKPVRDVAGKISDVVGSGFKKLTDFIGSNKQLQKFVMENPDVARDIEEVAGTLSASGQIAGDVLFAQGTAKTLTKGKNLSVQAGEKVAETAKTAFNASKPVLNKAGQIAKGTLDVGKGAYMQTKDFGKRVVTNLQDTAEQSRTLTKLPEPEAKLIRVGVDDASVKLMKESTPTEIKLYQDLVNKAKIKSGDLLAEQPKIVIGKEFMKPVEHLIKSKNSVGAKLGAVRQKLSNTPMDVTPQWKQFKAYLDSRGITVNSSGKFTGAGNMAKSDLVELQKMYNEIRPNNSGQVIRSQKWLDQWSQRTFKEYDLRQAREQSFSDDVTRTVEKARGIFKQALPQEYRTLSTQYSEVLKPVQEVAKLLGYKGDIDKLTTKQIKAAEVALRVIGNASDRPQAVIDGMLQVAGKYGYKSNVDLKKVIIFADALEDVYPNITPKRGLTGSTARGVNQSGLGVAGDVASGNMKSILGQVLDSTATQKEIQDALDAFLKSLTSNQ